MFCPKCGTKLPDDARFCGNCGAEMPARGSASRPAAQGARKHSNAAASAIPAASSGARAASSLSAKLPLQGVRIAAVVLVALSLLTAFMPWFVPTDQLSIAGGAVTGLAGLFSGGTLPSVSLEGDYGLWQMFTVVGEGQKLAQYLGSDALEGYFMLYWIPFALWVIALVLGVVGIAKTLGRNGGKAALVCSALVMFAASVACLFVGTFFQGSYVETIWPSGLVAGMVLSLVALVVSAACRGKAKEQAMDKAGRAGGGAA